MIRVRFQEKKEQKEPQTQQEESVSSPSAPATGNFFFISLLYRGKAVCEVKTSISRIYSREDCNYYG